MKLSEVLKDWPEKLLDESSGRERTEYPLGFNTALTSCDREIDREALIEEISRRNFYRLSYKEIAEIIISTMPTWLKRSEG